MGCLQFVFLFSPGFKWWSSLLVRPAASSCEHFLDVFLRWYVLGCHVFFLGGIAQRIGILGNLVGFKSSISIVDIFGFWCLCFLVTFTFLNDPIWHSPGTDWRLRFAIFWEGFTTWVVQKQRWICLFIPKNPSYVMFGVKLPPVLRPQNCH